MQYTTWGLACGGCGHAHRFVDAVERCQHRYRRHAEKVGSKAYRAVCRLDTKGYRHDIDDDEWDQLQELQVARFEGRRR